MTVKATVFNFITWGGGVEIENTAEGDHVTIVQRRADLSRNALRRLGVKKLRAMADQLEREISRGGNR